MEAGKNQLYFFVKIPIIVALLTKQPAIQLCRLTSMSVCLLCGADSQSQEMSPGETTTTFYQLKRHETLQSTRVYHYARFFFLSLRTAESLLRRIHFFLL